MSRVPTKEEVYGSSLSSEDAIRLGVEHNNKIRELEAQVLNQKIRNKRGLNTFNPLSGIESVGTERLSNNDPRNRIGKSSYDDFGLDGSNIDIDDYRDQQQGKLVSFGTGLARFLTTGVTSLLQGVASLGNTVPSLIQGVSSAIEKGSFSEGFSDFTEKIWHGAVSKDLHKLDEYFKETFKVYRSTAEQQASTWDFDRIFSEGMFEEMGDLFGFVAGAAVGGRAYSKILNSFNATAAWSDAAKLLTTSALSAVGEASIEAINSQKEYMQENQENNLSDYYKKLSEIQNNKELTEEQKKAATEELAKVYIARQNFAFENARNVGNSVFGLNMAILTASNAIAFAKPWFNGTIGDVRRMVNREITAIRELETKGLLSAKQAESRIQEVFRRQSTGQYLRRLEQSASNGIAFERDIAGNITRAFNDLSKFEPYREILTRMASEGTEEMSQRIASEASKYYYNSLMYHLEQSGFNKDAEEINLSMINSILQTGKKELQNPDAWYEFALGAFAGGIGSPVIMRGNDGKLKFWQGNAIQDINDFKSKNLQVELAVSELNKRIQGENNSLEEQLRFLNSSIMLTQAKEDAVREGRLDEYKDLEHTQLMLTVATFSKFGKLEDLIEMYSRMANMTAEEAQALIDSTQEEELGARTKGIFLNENGEARKNGEVAMHFNDLGRQSLNSIFEYKAAFDFFRDRLGYSAPDNFLSDLSVAQTKIYQWETELLNKYNELLNNGIDEHRDLINSFFKLMTSDNSILTESSSDRGLALAVLAEGVKNQDSNSIINQARLLEEKNKKAFKEIINTTKNNLKALVKQKTGKELKPEDFKSLLTLRDTFDKLGLDYKELYKTLLETSIKDVVNHMNNNDMLNNRRNDDGFLKKLRDKVKSMLGETVEKNDYPSSLSVLDAGNMFFLHNMQNLASENSNLYSDTFNKLAPEIEKLITAINSAYALLLQAQLDTANALQSQQQRMQAALDDQLYKKILSHIYSKFASELHANEESEMFNKLVEALLNGKKKKQYIADVEKFLKEQLPKEKKDTIKKLAQQWVDKVLENNKKAREEAKKRQEQTNLDDLEKKAHQLFTEVLHKLVVKLAENNATVNNILDSKELDPNNTFRTDLKNYLELITSLIKEEDARIEEIKNMNLSQEIANLQKTLEELLIPVPTNKETSMVELLESLRDEQGVNYTQDAVNKFINDIKELAKEYTVYVNQNDPQEGELNFQKITDELKGLVNIQPTIPGTPNGDPRPDDTPPVTPKNNLNKKDIEELNRRGKRVKIIDSDNEITEETPQDEVDDLKKKIEDEEQNFLNNIKKSLTDNDIIERGKAVNEAFGEEKFPIQPLEDDESLLDQFGNDQFIPNLLAELENLEKQLNEGEEEEELGENKGEDPEGGKEEGDENPNNPEDSELEDMTPKGDPDHNNVERVNQGLWSIGIEEKKNGEWVDFPNTPYIKQLQQTNPELASKLLEAFEICKKGMLEVDNGRLSANDEVYFLEHDGIIYMAYKDGNTYVPFNIVNTQSTPKYLQNRAEELRKNNDNDSQDNISNRVITDEAGKPFSLKVKGFKGRSLFFTDERVPLSELTTSNGHKVDPKNVVLLMSYESALRDYDKIENRHLLQDSSVFRPGFPIMYIKLPNGNYKIVPIHMSMFDNINDVPHTLRQELENLNYNSDNITNDLFEVLSKYFYIPPSLRFKGLRFTSKRDNSLHRGVLNIITDAITGNKYGNGVNSSDHTIATIHTYSTHENINPQDVAQQILEKLVGRVRYKITSSNIAENMHRLSVNMKYASTVNNTIVLEDLTESGEKKDSQYQEQYRHNNHSHKAQQDTDNLENGVDVIFEDNDKTRRHVKLRPVYTETNPLDGLHNYVIQSYQNNGPGTDTTWVTLPNNGNTVTTARFLVDLHNAIKNGTLENFLNSGFKVKQEGDGFSYGLDPNKRIYFTLEQDHEGKIVPVISNPGIDSNDLEGRVSTVDSKNKEDLGEALNLIYDPKAESAASNFGVDETTYQSPDGGVFTRVTEKTASTIEENQEEIDNLLNGRLASTPHSKYENGRPKLDNANLNTLLENRKKNNPNQEARNIGRQIDSHTRIAIPIMQTLMQKHIDSLGGALGFITRNSIEEFLTRDDIVDKVFEELKKKDITLTINNKKYIKELAKNLSFLFAEFGIGSSVKYYTSPIVLTDKNSNTAGSPDIIVYNKDRGELSVIDLKTSFKRNNYHKNNIFSITEDIQVLAYRKLLFQTLSELLGKDAISEHKIGAYIFKLNHEHNSENPTDISTISTIQSGFSNYAVPLRRIKSPSSTTQFITNSMSLFNKQIKSKENNQKPEDPNNPNKTPEEEKPSTPPVQTTENKKKQEENKKKDEKKQDKKEPENRDKEASSGNSSQSSSESQSSTNNKNRIRRREARKKMNNEASQTPSVDEQSLGNLTNQVVSTLKELGVNLGTEEDLDHYSLYGVNSDVITSVKEALELDGKSIAEHQIKDVINKLLNDHRENCGS